MGMFYNKLMKESATVEVEDVVQTPDDVGVDLDAIEKAIAGKDGIEAHRDEIEAAEEGVVGDPLEEAAIIMYESEYNYNQILRCIGIAELAEFAEGRDFVLEGANLDAFFEKTRAMFTKMFEGLTKLFSQAVTKLSEKMSFDKALVRKHGEEIRAGFFENTGWRFENAYDMDKLNVKYEPKKSELWAIADADINEALSGGEVNQDGLSHIAAVKRVSGKTVSDEAKAAGEMLAQLKDEAFVTVTYDNSSAPATLLNTVLDILKGDNDVKALRATYNEIKKDYKELMKWLKDTKSKLNATKKEENTQKAQSTCMAYVTVAKYEKNLQHSYFAHCVRAHNTRRSQARRMALAWQRAGGKKQEVQHNSTLFNLSFI